MEFDDEAISLLDRGLSGLQTEEIDNQEILIMYRDARCILQSNPECERDYQNAESVYYSCVRAIRALYLPEKAKILSLNGDEFYLDAKEQVICAQRNYVYILDLLRRES